MTGTPPLKRTPLDSTALAAAPIPGSGADRDAERLARATISMVVEPGDLRCLGLTGRLGGVEFLDVLRRHPDLRPELAAASARLAEVEPERTLEQAERQGIRFVIPGDEEWPEQLEDLTEAGELQQRGEVPAGLWVKGPLRLDRLGRSVAIVGSRSATTYGDQLASDLAAVVAAAGHPVVSGAAFGIDYAAHRGAVGAGAATVAVLACGVDRAYPAAHRDMLRYLGENHAVVSEAPLGASPFRIRFLARNRVIAALTRGTVVVEAAVRSGALNTASWAERLNRVVMGTPGPLTSVASQGVNQLLRSGAATLVTGPDDVLELLGSAGENLTQELRAPEQERDRLSVPERQVLDAVPVLEPAPTASIAFVAGLGAPQVAHFLEGLEERGLVEARAGGWRLTERGRA
ncbi:DNA-protecting protein DprA [Nocardioides sp. zg-536]|uniref:DNA-protecting protein DprA n=1 Tax=Nocardioides faecalis TaxID=2803858 RepID=A0A939BVW9_9ACTN|nr:DNA-processing protein DprA [Nocardioides faecalis]MBM9460406.1 DNA-protecting protein DprA [Nocardioides faecalis]QVI59769.1 DNA-processing protein DprA [Nocardioides faecalis]